MCDIYSIWDKIVVVCFKAKIRHFSGRNHSG